MAYINSGSSWSHCLFTCKSDAFFPQQFSFQNLYIMTFKGPYYPKFSMVLPLSKINLMELP